MTKTKVVDLNEFYNFIIDGFCHLKSCTTLKFYSKCQILKFKLRPVQTNSDGGMAKIKVVNLDDIYNFVVDDFLALNHLLSQNRLLCQNRSISHFVM
jgi:hypothetical protein